MDWNDCPMDRSPPLVSIVTPSLNHGRFIGETIESVLRQDHPRIEYLVVDGGSGDGTLDVLRAYGGRLPWISEPDYGQAAAINKGWRTTSGKIIAWLNADDVLYPEAVSAVVAYLNAHSDIDAVYGDCAFIDVQGRQVGTYPARPFDYHTLVRGAVNYIPQPATFIRRRVLNRIGYLDESLHYVMDFDYWLRLGVRQRVAYLPGVRLAALRLHQTAKSVRAVAGFAPEIVRVYEHLFARQDLSGALRRLRAEALSNAYYQAAYFCFWSGQIDAARRYALSAWRRRPLRPRRPLLFAVTGAVGLAILRRWVGVPFARPLTTRRHNTVGT